MNKILILFAVFGLIVTSCKDDDPIPQINANFSASAVSVLTGSSVTFTDLSTNDPTEWNWTFEGGNPAQSSDQNPTILYENPGVFEVSLASSNSGSTDDEVKVGFITVSLPQIETDFSASMEMVVQGGSIMFSDLSTNNPSVWEWSFEGGNPAQSSDQNPTVIYETPGVYEVSLTSSNTGNSDLEIKPEFINVLQKLEARFNISDSIVNQDSEISFTDTSIGIPTDWLWEFEGGTPSTSTTSNPTISYSTPGVFDLKLTISNEVDTDDIVMEQRITILPVSGLIAHYPFNGNALDESGNSLDGELIGAALTSDRFGNSNQAMYFDGIDDRIEVANNSLLESPTFSISVWFRALNDKGAFVSMSDFDPIRADAGYYLSIVNGNLRGLTNIGSGSWARNVDEGVVSLDEWHHVVFTFNGTYLELFLDGDLVSTLEQQHTVNYSEHNPLQFGTYYSPSGETIYTGDMDDIRIFNRALDENEVKALYRE